MERTLIKDAFVKEDSVLLKGWVHETRDLKKVRFLILKDITGRMQVTGIDGKTDAKVFDLLDNLNRESVVQVTGTLKECKQAPNGKELIPDSIEIIAEAKNPLPIDASDYSKTELPLRLDNRFLDLHSARTQAIFKIQSTIGHEFLNYFIKKGFTYCHTPSMIGASSEGGTELFKAKYFDKEVFLAQSPQLYKQMIACSMENMVTITPVWRAEKHNTVRHLNECRQMDIEMAFADSKTVLEEMGKAVQYIVKQVIEKNAEELEVLKLKLEVPKTKYLTFAETKELVEKEGIKIPKDDLTGEAEKKLEELFPNTVTFVYDWPMKGKPFYIMPKDEDAAAELSEGFDAIYKGMEISSGGQRIHIPELLEKMLKTKDMNPKDFKSYIDSFRYGAPPHAGWSIGIERFTQVLLEISNVREVCMFPRDRDRITP
ncbi:aspartate--tRNA(Asn) ligase [archaeon]|jgi:nondiscriminating aspartyl-tRNA synthetase|nr:aspartate--tRNA(Asn) ligase [archaeon]MBT7128345.1 aspartate--tRNA(Asn) ligase [archaeon]